MKKMLILILLVPFLSVKAQEKGSATYYANRFHNKKTASGVIYKKDSLVCAHRTHPFGTLLRVRNLSNDKEVIVKVIDRGPFKKGRVIDLSYAAAKQLGMIRQGVAKVEVYKHE